MEDVTRQAEESLRLDSADGSHSRLIVLFGLLFIAIVFAIFFLNGANTDPVAVAVPANTQIPDMTPTANPDPMSGMKQEKSQIAGYVAGIIPNEENKSKWVELQVQLPKPGTPALESGTDKSSAPLDMETSFYKFYLGEEVEGVESIVGGENITVFFDGEPSATEYVPATSFEFLTKVEREAE